MIDLIGAIGVMYVIYLLCACRLVGIELMELLAFRLVVGGCSAVVGWLLRIG